MIEIIINNDNYYIDNYFQVKGKDEKIKELVKKIIDIEITNLHPEDGDPFLILHNELKKYKFIKIISFKEIENEEEKVY